MRPILATIALALVLTGGLSGCSTMPQQRQPASVLATIGHVALSAPEVANGSVVKIAATLSSLPRFGKPKITAFLDDRAIPLYRSPEDPQVYEAWIPIPIEHQPATTRIRVVNGEGPDAAVDQIPLKIIPGSYRIQRLKVDPERVQPSKKNQERMDREDAELQQLYANPRSERFWNREFEKPVESVATASFGAKRIFNGKPRGFHLGLDLRAQAGTRVHASAPGIIVLARELFISGNTVIIDHGQGFFTFYGHLSEIRFPEGTHVDEGEVIGLSGNTGRSTGPHLHWGTIINGVPVNPLDVVEATK